MGEGRYGKNCLQYFLIGKAKTKTKNLKKNLDHFMELISEGNTRVTQQGGVYVKDFLQRTS